METITIKTKDEYSVYVEEGLLTSSYELLERNKLLADVKKIVIITDNNVNELYGKRLEDEFKNKGFEILKFVIPPGETSKNNENSFKLLKYLATNKVRVNDLIITFGGGVVGDLGAFCASIYMRGMKFVQIPTTLLSMVDSSIGGKNAINLPQGKNLVGTFWQPSMVLIDCSLLSSLDDDELLNGFTEVIKAGFISDKDLINEIIDWNIYDIKKVENIKKCIIKSLNIKRILIEQDTFDKSIRNLLNLGHTFGHAIEQLSFYSIKHGHSVAIGMFMVAKAGYERGLVDTNVYHAISKILKNFNFELDTNFSNKQIFRATLSDKKIKNDRITIVIPKELGKSYLYEMPLGELESFVALGRLEHED